MSDEFEFGEGDRVLARLRENGTRGNIVSKLRGEVVRFEDNSNALLPDRALIRIDPTDQTIRLKEYEAEFEILETANDADSEEVATDGGGGIEPLAEEYSEIDLGEFVEVAAEKSAGEAVPLLDLPGESADDLDLVRLSATFLDENGISREFSIESDGFGPEEYGGGSA